MLPGDRWIVCYAGWVVSSHPKLADARLQASSHALGAHIPTARLSSRRYSRRLRGRALLLALRAPRPASVRRLEPGRYAVTGVALGDDALSTPAVAIEIQRR